jgi:hypothetical protein
MIRVDTKHLARFERIGHRTTGDRRKGCSPGAGHEKAHVAVDDATRMAYVVVVPDEQKATTVGFLVRLCRGSTAKALPAAGCLKATAVHTTPGIGVASGLHGTGTESQTLQGLQTQINGKPERVWQLADVSLSRGSSQQRQSNLRMG